jgi:hypothetical protein
MEWTGVERRASDNGRMRVDRPVAVFVGGQEGIRRGRTVDLSTGGMRIDLDEGLDEGEKVLFRIDLGDGFDPAVQGGEVVWSAPDRGTGVRFTSAGEVEGPPALDEDASPPPDAGADVRLEIERMDHPLKVRCVEALPEGLVVRTDLPFLRMGRTVSATYAAPDGSEGRLEGVLSSVSLLPEDSPVPAIRLEIRTDGREGPLGGGESDLPAEPGGGAADETWEDAGPPAPDAEVPPVEEEREAAGTGRVASVPRPERPVETQPETEPAPASGPEAPEAGRDEGQAVEGDDPMTDAFQSFTERSERAAGECTDGCRGDSIEPAYVIALQSAWAAARELTGRAARVLAATAALVWARLRPALRALPPLLERRARVIREAAGPLASRVASRVARAGVRLPGRTTRVRKQKRRTVRASKSSTAASLLGSKLFVLALAAAAVVGFGTGIWALVGLIGSGEDVPAAEAGSAPGDAAPAEGSFDLWGGTDLPQGQVVESPESEIEIVAAPAAPSEAPTAEVAGTGALAAEAPAAAAREGTPETGIVPAPATAEVGTTGFYLAVDGDVTGYDYYPLKDPAGLVVDVKGALPAREGMQPVEREGIRQVKAIARESGTRFIIYFEGSEIPDFQVLPAGSSLEVRVNS